MHNRKSGVSDRIQVKQVAAYLYTTISMGIVAFQLALAAGVPWGAYAMGGAFPGQFPPALRVAAIIQAGIIVITAVIVLVRAEVIPSKKLSRFRWLVWGVVTFSAVSLVLNLLTPSASERAIWAPVALLLLISSIVVARAKPQRDLAE